MDIIMKPAPKAARHKNETKLFSARDVETWKLPPFQRPLRVNDKVKAMADELKDNGGIITGILTLGQLADDDTYWLVDGQHRIEAFKISGLREGIADVRIIRFDTMPEMADEFVKLNTALVKMRPDDVLRGLESSCPALLKIKTECPFVGYDHVRRNTNSPLLSMTLALRCWMGSRPETPTLAAGGSATNMATTIDQNETVNCIHFLQIAYAAWGRGPENQRLWGNLNLCLCAWLFRRVVLDKERGGLKRSVTMMHGQFKQCLMSLAADRNYNDWLHGRNMGERDRRPAYNQYIKVIFAKRIADESKNGVRPKLPAPAWSVS